AHGESRDIPGQPLYSYRISDDTIVGPKQKIVLVGGNHGGEPLGSHALEGMVDFLLSSDPMAASIRRRAEIFVYPQVNPEGRYAGYFRTSVERPDDNYNRTWDCSNGGSDKALIRDSMVADVGGPIDILLDFHNQFEELDGIDEVLVGAANTGDDYVVNLAAAGVEIVTPSTSFSGVLRNWAASTYDGTSSGGLGASLAITPEPRPGAGRTIADYRAHGEVYGRSLYATLQCPSTNPCVGDINADGTVDSLDLLVVLGGWGLCCDGDLNCDGTVDSLDLLLVLGAWGPCP
ncbi:MAG: M14 family zinc carboxypeptidase, partial [Planctomycetota bacterium]